MIQVSSGTANILWKYLHAHILGGFEWHHYTEGCLGQIPSTHISMGLTDEESWLKGIFCLQKHRDLLDGDLKIFLKENIAQ